MSKTNISSFKKLMPSLITGLQEAQDRNKGRYEYKGCTICSVLKYNPIWKTLSDGQKRAFGKFLKTKVSNETFSNICRANISLPARYKMVVS